jgi:Domain of unknown function (DUF4351)
MELNMRVESTHYANSYINQLIFKALSETIENALKKVLSITTQVNKAISEEKNIDQTISTNIDNTDLSSIVLAEELLVLARHEMQMLSSILEINHESSIPANINDGEVVNISGKLGVRIVLDDCMFEVWISNGSNYYLNALQKAAEILMSPGARDNICPFIRNIGDSFDEVFKALVKSLVPLSVFSGFLGMFAKPANATTYTALANSVAPTSATTYAALANSVAPTSATTYAALANSVAPVSATTHAALANSVTSIATATIAGKIILFSALSIAAVMLIKAGIHVYCPLPLGRSYQEEEIANLKILQEKVISQLRQKFGDLINPLVELIQTLDNKQIRMLNKDLLNFRSIDELKVWLEKNKKD